MSESKRAKLPDGWQRRTFIISDKHSDLIQRAEYYDRKQIKEIIYEALDQYFKDRDDLKPLPDRTKIWEL